MKIAVCMIGIVCALSYRMDIDGPYRGICQDDPRLEGAGDARARQGYLCCRRLCVMPPLVNPIAFNSEEVRRSGLTIRNVGPPNISPDPIDGIGGGHVFDLANALVTGVSPRGKHYYPAFPHTSYTGMKLAEIQDLYSYL